MRKSLYKDVFKTLVVLVLVMAACRVTNGAFCFVIAFCGALMAFQGKYGRSICCYMILPMMVNVSPALLPKVGEMWGVGIRFGAMIVAVAMVLSSTRRLGRHRLPFGAIIPRAREFPVQCREILP